MSESDPPELDYAPPAAWHQRGSTRRWAIGMAVLVVLLLGVRWVPVIYSHVAMLYWQRHLVSHVNSPETIVFSWRAQAGDVPATSAMVPPAWSAFYSHASPPGLRSAGTPFVHEMQATPDLPKRLVAVDVDAGDFQGDWIDLQARVFSFASIGRNPRELARTALGPQPFRTSVQVHAGQLTPGDPSHATIHLTLDGEPVTIHLWLLPDDTVILERGE